VILRPCGPLRYSWCINPEADREPLPVTLWPGGDLADVDLPCYRLHFTHSGRVRLLFESPVSSMLLSSLQLALPLHSHSIDNKMVLACWACCVAGFPCHLTDFQQLHSIWRNQSNVMLGQLLKS